MGEDFLQFIWKSLNFDLANLKTTDGNKVTIRHQGFLNHDQGPDFLGAKIRIGYLEWSGQVEIHVQSKEWETHGHHRDSNYNNVILHVVEEAGNKPIIREDGTEIPELSLKGRIPDSVIKTYDRLRLSQDNLPCGALVKGLDQVHLINWLDRCGLDRIEDKASRIKGFLKNDLHDWEQVLWEELAGIIGGLPNGKTFREIARNCSIKIIRKHLSNAGETEALLFGTAGLLESRSRSRYFLKLREHWQFLSAKYGLNPVFQPIRFLRMRPASFPTIRISQLASLIKLFPVLSELLLPANIGHFMQANIQVSPYWQRHLKFGHKRKRGPGIMGIEMKRSLMVNVLLPISWLYHRSHGNDSRWEEILNILENLPPENNRITRLYTQNGLKPKNILHSQGLIHLKKNYCEPRKCLNCALGNYFLKPKKERNGTLSRRHHRNRSGSKSRT